MFTNNNMDALSVSSDLFHGVGLGINSEEDLELKIISHRNNYYKNKIGLYVELLANIIKYRFTSPELLSVDWLLVENTLRRGYFPVICPNALGVFGMWGYVKNYWSINNNETLLFSSKVVDYDSIIWTIHKNLIPKKTPDFHEITKLDDCETGQFIVMKNKPFQMVSDYAIMIQHIEAMTEIESSKFSLYMQSKALVVPKGDENDESLNVFISKYYNSGLFMKASKRFDPETDITKLDNTDLASRIVELQRAQDNEVVSLNSDIGMDSLGINKESGVSDIEATSGDPYSKSRANTYLNARNNALILLNKRFNFDVKAEFDNNISGEITNKDESDNNNEMDNDNRRNHNE
jgi:hypothetical protein